MDKKFEIPIILDNIQDDGCHLFVNMEINGADIRVLIDTGASRTAFDMGRIKSCVLDYQAEENKELTAGLGGSNLKSEVFFVKEIKIGELLIENYQAVAIDMSHVNEVYGQIGSMPIDGVLGGDLLSKYNAIIDYGVLKMFLYDKTN